MVQVCLVDWSNAKIAKTFTVFNERKVVDSLTEKRKPTIFLKAFCFYPQHDCNIQWAKIMNAFHGAKNTHQCEVKFTLKISDGEKAKEKEKKKKRETKWERERERKRASRARKTKWKIFVFKTFQSASWSEMMKILLNCSVGILLSPPIANVSLTWPRTSVYIWYYIFTNGNWPRNIYDPIKVAHFFSPHFKSADEKYQAKYSTTAKKNTDVYNKQIRTILRRCYMTRMVLHPRGNQATQLNK